MFWVQNFTLIANRSLTILSLILSGLSEMVLQKIIYLQELINVIGFENSHESSNLKMYA